MKKLEHLLLFTMLTIGCACLHTGCTYDDFLSATKPCGAGAHWDFDFETGALTISGEGAVEGTPYDETMKSAITSVTISEGITSIGDSVFVDCENIKSVYWNAKNCNRTIFGPCEIVYREVEFNAEPIKEVLGYPVESFVLGEQVEIIPERLCANMQKITEIVIPNSVKEIGYCAFRQCYGLTKITIGDHVKKIDKRAFQNCSSLTSIIIPNSVTELGDTAFYQCSMLSDVTLGEGVLTIGDRMFYACHSLKNITLSKVSRIGNSAFRNCSSLTSINLQNVSRVGDNAFSGSGLTSVTIPSNVLWIGKNAFTNCTKLESVTIHEHVYVKSKTFTGCDKLKSFVFADDVHFIPDSICYNMNALKKVTMLSDRIDGMGSYAFAYCDSLTTVICKAINPPGALIMHTAFEQRESRKIEYLYVPAASVERYKNSTDHSINHYKSWPDFFENILPIEEN